VVIVRLFGDSFRKKIGVLIGYGGLGLFAVDLSWGVFCHSLYFLKKWEAHLCILNGELAGRISWRDTLVYLVVLMVDLEAEVDVVYCSRQGGQRRRGLE